MMYTLHIRSRHGVYRKLYDFDRFSDAFDQLIAAVVKLSNARYWISTANEAIPHHSRLFEYDPDHDTLEDLISIRDD